MKNKKSKIAFYFPISSLIGKNSPPIKQFQLSWNIILKHIYKKMSDHMFVFDSVQNQKY